ncbi:hypothetical protein AGMMS49936_10020 [Endomicrobiia bacterium]|nr:hypothetical protein AGMMS49936_10020 [Endomicrobiia bacterium]
MMENKTQWIAVIVAITLAIIVMVRAVLVTPKNSKENVDLKVQQ